MPQVISRRNRNTFPVMRASIILSRRAGLVFMRISFFRERAFRLRKRVLNEFGKGRLVLSVRWLGFGKGRLLF